MSSVVVLGLVGAVCTLVVIFEMLRRQRLREKYAVIWVTVAIGTMLVALAPGVLTWAAEIVGVQLPVNLLFFLASMVLLLLSIQYSYEIGRLEDRTRTLAEEIALLRMQLDALRGAAGATSPTDPPLRNARSGQGLCDTDRGRPAPAVGRPDDVLADPASSTDEDRHTGNRSSPDRDAAQESG